MSRGNLARLLASSSLAVLPISIGTVLLGALTGGSLGFLPALLGIALDLVALTIVSVVAFEFLTAAGNSSSIIDRNILRLLE